MKKVAILLSGCGVYDGVEIQESISTMLAIEELGASYLCIGINENQHHVINHLTGEEMNENRNMLVEAARIARGDIQEISKVEIADFDALVIPGGFGSAKNLTNWAFNGPDGTISDKVKLLIVNCINAGKPIAALCVSPVVIAKALENSELHAQLTMGNTTQSSPYTIADFHAGIEKVGTIAQEAQLGEVVIDKQLKIVSAPCYMMNASILEVKNNISKAMKALLELTN